MTIETDKELFKVNVNKAWAGQTLWQLYQEAHTPWEWQPKLKGYAQSKGILLFSSAFDETSIDLLEDKDASLYKIASFEAGDVQFLQKIGGTRKPIVISRGLTPPEDVKLAITTLQSAGSPAVAVLHCVSSHPATLDQMNISTVAEISKYFGVISGLSDHSLDITASVTAVPFGACILEKHFTLKRDEGRVDATFSLEPEEMKQLVNMVREVEKAIGKSTYEIGDKEKENIVFKRSIFVVKNIKAGEKFTAKNIRSIHPGYGLAPQAFI